MNTFFFSNFIIGLFMLFFSYEMIPFLSTRVLYLLWLVMMLVWLGFILRDLAKIPKLIEEKKKEHEYKKYIP